jgi:D-alanyl-D-alanine carboxypeptidase/D-alanyl-D-alanine-endopeptidase (penicillin-binding protein 4)
VLASYQSPSLAELLYGLNRYSNNFMAEMLLRSLGARIMGPPGTTTKGISVIGRTLQEIGVPQHEVSLTSGSGLSRRCRASPRAFGLVLLRAYEDASVGPSFLSSLAVNGQEGTLKHRLLKANSTIRGKTGTLNDVVTFSGYVTDLKGEIMAVTVLMNEVPNLWQAREALDAFLERITEEQMLP